MKTNSFFSKLNFQQNKYFSTNNLQFITKSWKVVRIGRKPLMSIYVPICISRVLPKLIPIFKNLHPSASFAIDFPIKITVNFCTNWSLFLHKRKQSDFVPVFLAQQLAHIKTAKNEVVLYLTGNFHMVCKRKSLVTACTS